MKISNQASNNRVSISGETLGKVLAFILVTFPIFFVYRTIISSVSISDSLLVLCIIICLPYLLMQKLYLNKIALSFAAICIYLLLVLAFEIVSGYQADVLMKYIRYLTYFFVALVVCPKFDCYTSAKKIYRFFACYTSLLIIVQYIGYYALGQKISGYIPFLPVMGTSDWQSLQSLSLSVSIYRPCSMFAEPAHYGAYAAGYLGISLGDDTDPAWVRILLTLGLMLSTSSTAIACGVLLWIIWMVHNRKVTIKKMIIALLIVAGFILLIQTTSIQYSLDRVLGTGLGVSGRFNTYMLLFEDIKNDPLGYLFGHGFIYEMKFIYIPGWGAFFYCFGIVGTFLLLFMVLQLWKNVNIEKRMLIAVLSVLSVGTLSLVSYNFMLYIGIATFGLDINHNISSSFGRKNECANYYLKNK